MSGPVILFKAKVPAALNEWEAANTPLFDKWRADVVQLKEDLGGRDTLRRNIGWAEGWVASGYIEPDRKAAPLPGFRRDSGSGHMLPALRTKVGKEWAARLSAITYRPAPTPGVPEIVMGGGYMGAFRIEHLGDDWFAWLGFNPYAGGDNPREMEKVDADLWEEAKFSEYYAAKEAAPAK